MAGKGFPMLVGVAPPPPGSEIVTEGSRGRWLLAIQVNRLGSTQMRTSLGFACLWSNAPSFIKILQNSADDQDALKEVHLSALKRHMFPVDSAFG